MRFPERKRGTRAPLTLTAPSPSRSAQPPDCRRRDLFGTSAEAMPAKTSANNANALMMEKTCRAKKTAAEKRQSVSFWPALAYGAGKEGRDNRG